MKPGEKKPGEKVSFGDAPRAVIYTRVSTDGQKENTSLAAQFAICQRKAQELGALVVGFHEETLSGALYRARPGIQAALADIEEGRANTLIVSRLDRQGRDVDALRDIRRRVEEAGGQMVFADGLNFAPNAIGRYLHTNISGIAELEREMIRERLIGGLREKVKNGVQVSRSYFPYGYSIVRNLDVLSGKEPPGSEGQYRVAPEQAAWIAPIFEHIARGAGLNATGSFLQSQGVPSPRNGKFWRSTTISRIIRNSLYKGEPGWGKSRAVLDESREDRGLGRYYEVPTPEAQWLPLSAPPLVSAELWEAANAQLRMGREANSGRTDRKYALSGLLRCPHCGARMVVRSQNTRGKNTSSYVCRHALRYSQTPEQQKSGTCPCRYYANNVLERVVIQAVIGLLADPRLMTAAASEWNKSQKLRSGGKNEGDEVRLRKELDQLARREMAAAESKIEAKVAGQDSAVFDRMLQEVGARRELIEARLRELQAIAAPAPEVRLPSDAEMLASALKSGEASGDSRASGAEKRELLGQVIEAIYPTAPRRRLGGVRIVLKTASNEGGPFYVLTNIEKLIRSADGSVDDVTPGISLELCATLPGPPLPPRAPYFPV